MIGITILISWIIYNNFHGNQVRVTRKNKYDIDGFMNEFQWTSIKLSVKGKLEFYGSHT